jgi:glycosyltransferase involved in cell wall biosynthesis
MDFKKTFSVLISVFNGADYIERSVESILSQSFRDFELLIVDDGSTDNTWDIVTNMSDLRIRVFRQDNHGKSVALNRMLDEAVGRYVVIQDADDLSKPDRLFKIFKSFQENKDVGLILTGYDLLLENKVLAPRGSRKSVDECSDILSCFRMPSLDPTMAVKADLAKKVRFDPRFRIGQGIAFIIHASELAGVLCLPDILYTYRINYNSNTKRGRDIVDRRKKCMTLVYEDAIERRRASGLRSPSIETAIEGVSSSRDNNLAGHFTDSCYMSVAVGNRREAIHTAYMSLKMLPKSFSYLKPLIYAVSPRFLVDLIKYRGRVPKVDQN